MNDDDLPPTDDEGWGEVAANKPDKKPATAEAGKSSTNPLSPRAGEITARPPEEKSEPKPSFDKLRTNEDKPKPAAEKPRPTTEKPKPAAEKSKKIPERLKAHIPKPQKAAAKKPPAATKPAVEDRILTSTADDTKKKKKKKKRSLFSRDKKGGDGGAKPPRDGAPSSGGTGRQRLYMAAAALAILAIGIGLSYRNAQFFHVVCHAQSITAEKGSFFLWGSSQLSGDEWRPIAIDEAYNCTDRTVSSKTALAQLFADAIIVRADQSIASPDADVEEIATQLGQALLLTRGESGKRAKVDRLLGDVAYRRGAAKLKNIAAELKQGGELFGDAAKRRPIHSNNADLWRKFAESLNEELGKGPPELRPEEDKPKPAAAVTPTPRPVADGTGGEAAPPLDAGPPPAPDANPATRGGVLL